MSILIRHFITVYRKNPKKTAIVSLSALIIYIAMISFVMYTENKNKGIERAKNLSYESQMGNLKQVEGNLESLLTYIEDQKVRLRQSEDLLNSLKSEKEKLEPLVKADRDVVKAVFDFQGQTRENNAWGGYIVSYILGVLSSITATLTIKAFTR